MNNQMTYEFPKNITMSCGKFTLSSESFNFSDTLPRIPGQYTSTAPAATFPFPTTLLPATTVTTRSGFQLYILLCGKILFSGRESATSHCQKRIVHNYCLQGSFLFFVDKIEQFDKTSGMWPHA